MSWLTTSLSKQFFCQLLSSPSHFSTSIYTRQLSPQPTLYKPTIQQSRTFFDLKPTPVIPQNQQSYSPFSSTMSPSHLASKNQPNHLRQQNYEPPPPGALINKYGPGEKAMAASFAVALVLFAYSSLDLGRSAKKAYDVVDELKGMTEQEFLFHEMRKQYNTDMGLAPPPLPPKSATPTQIIPFPDQQLTSTTESPVLLKSP